MFVWPAHASSKQAMPTSCVVEAMNSKWKLVLKNSGTSTILMSSICQDDTLLKTLSSPGPFNVPTQAPPRDDIL